MSKVKDFINGCKLAFHPSEPPAAHVPLRVLGGRPRGRSRGSARLGSARFGSARRGRPGARQAARHVARRGVPSAAARLLEAAAIPRPGRPELDFCEKCFLCGCCCSRGAQVGGARHRASPTLDLRSSEEAAGGRGAHRGARDLGARRWHSQEECELRPGSSAQAGRPPSARLLRPAACGGGVPAGVRRGACCARQRGLSNIGEVLYLQEGFSAYLSVMARRLCYGADSEVSLNINPFPSDC